MGEIIIGNKHFRLTVGDDCKVKSFVRVSNGKNLAVADEEVSLFSVTQERPFNNEIKLAYMNKKTTYQANRLVREGDILTVGFELAPYDALVAVKECDDYVSFTLQGFRVHPDGYNSYLCMDTPPVSEFRLLQLPLAHGERFGEWLNIIHGDGFSAAVIAASPCERIDSEKRSRCRILTADADANLKLIGSQAAIIARETDDFLDSMDTFERDFSLPLGVQSRRSAFINSSIYWTEDPITPETIDEHIAIAKKGGFQLMLFNYRAFFRETVNYHYIGNYDFRKEIANKEDDVKRALEKISKAGLHAGIHFLHTHIGMKSRYVTPVPDHRLGIKKQFTLARDIGADETVIYVEESTAGSPMHDGCRVLKFGGELISYQRCTCEKPYRFEGCVRGYNDTTASPHSAGLRGGILDISEYGATSVYLDQNTDLQDEIAEKIGAFYNLGFAFAYFDGSEGTNAPFAYHIPNAQYRVYQKFAKPPIFCEGAAKTHFSWHMLSGGNAFDVFSTEEYKRCIVRFPFEEARMLKDSFTRVNFGWWGLRKDTRPDIFEFGTSRAAAWDCPATVLIYLKIIQNHPRRDDICEVLRRWEDVRAKGLLSAEDKARLKDTKREHIMLINEKGDYELCEYEEIALGTGDVSAFYFERSGESYVVTWCNTGSGEMTVPWRYAAPAYTEELGGREVAYTMKNGKLTLPVAGRRYIKACVCREEMIASFKAAVFHKTE